MQHIDTLIHARWIIPVVPEHSWHEDHALAVHDGTIIDLLPAAEAARKYRADVSLHLEHHALIPGLINTHTHVAMSLFRGLADDLPLMEWLNHHIWPAERRWVSPDFVHDGSRLALAEMLRGGTTCFNDMYFFPDETARLAAENHMRASIGMILIDFPTVWAADADEYIRKGLKLHDDYRNHPLIKTTFAPHAPYTVSDAPLQRVATLAEELDVPIHMHVHETADEVAASVEQHIMRPLQRLDTLGLVSPRLLAVHMTQLDDDDIELMARLGGHVVHCPESNLKLASGFCPLDRLLKAGINVALGTDGAASNNDLDMFGEMRSAALLAKAVAGDASAVPAATALSMATINGARALGIDAETGSLEIGKSADLVAVDLGGLDSQPLYNPISQLVYATGRDKVSDVWIAGKHVVKDATLTTMDENMIRHKAVAWGEKIRAADEQQ
ncbi:N-ethylammeline chlorohydrolase [Candidatus Tenderia electrophaga]|jgi:5-methylthioadenosine/S-adenosylhomocysteine deaminase|uniref:5-methylthioadenosine/S-adenosylhomocysteine deaminase n=1 Tax=Candidatus Tenderia electrophaga TaxID=1748243 RepID=A0A0S2TDF2_9GAMM|nr:N-ethylammeline chlorohydrolase [Candidatus Tenderia electrophaga]